MELNRNNKNPLIATIVVTLDVGNCAFNHCFVKMI